MSVARSVGARNCEFSRMRERSLLLWSLSRCAKKVELYLGSNPVRLTVDLLQVWPLILKNHNRKKQEKQRKGREKRRERKIFLFLFPLLFFLTFFFIFPCPLVEQKRDLQHILLDCSGRKVRRLHSCTAR